MIPIVRDFSFEEDFERPDDTYGQDSSLNLSNKKRRRIIVDRKL